MHRAILLVTVLAACGDDGGVRTLDDAPPFDAAPGMATVTVRAGRHLLANHTVYFQAPDSSEIATVQTDAEGRASAVVPDGSSVTTLVPGNGATSTIYTVMGVKPQDALTLTVATNFEQPDVTFTFPAYTGVATAVYAIDTTCGGEGVGEGTTHVLAQDLCSPRTDTMVLARDVTGTQHVAYLAKLDQPFADTIDLAGETWMEIVPSTTTYTNIPAETVRTTAARNLVTPRGVLARCYGGAGAPPTHIAALSCATLTGATMRDVFMYTDHQLIHDFSQVATAPSSTIDLANVTVRGASDAPIDGATRTLSWTETAGAAPDFVWVRLIEQGATPYDRYVLAPYDSTSITLPSLIGDAAVFDLEAGDEPYIELRLGTATGGYDAIRPHGPMYEDSVSNEIERIVTSRPYDG